MADAQASLQQALEQLDERAGRQRTVVLFDLAAAHAAADPAHGMTLAGQALDLLEHEPYGAAYGRIPEVRQALDWTPQAQMLDERLSEQLPADLQVIPDVDIDLELVPPGQPGWSRRPDLIVVHQVAVERVRREGGLLRACEVVVLVEIVSPGSRRTDHVIKRSEYADAGIRHYWIVDVDSPVSLINCHLAEGFGYQDGGAVTSEYTMTEPISARPAARLAALTSHRPAEVAVSHRAAGRAGQELRRRTWTRGKRSKSRSLDRTVSTPCSRHSATITASVTSPPRTWASLRIVRSSSQ